MVTGKYPFEGSNVYTLFENISQGKYTVPEDIDDELKDLIQSILNVDYKTRFTIDEIRKHSYLCSRLLMHRWMSKELPDEGEVEVVISPSVFDSLKPSKKCCVLI